MGLMNSSKNKLNSKISWLFNLEPNALILCVQQVFVEMFCYRCHGLIGNYRISIFRMCLPIVHWFVNFKERNNIVFML